jgi:dihydrofolate reductase
MARLIAAMITSLDGYVADEQGRFDWSVPDEEVHRFVNDLERPIGTYLYGRRMYEVMVAWETLRSGGADASPAVDDYAAIWRASEKIVYSTTLTAPASARTRIERAFAPEAVRTLKAASEHDLAIGGPELAGEALAAGLVDELHLLLSPVIVGGGRRALPDGLKLGLELLDQRTFGNGVVHVRYAVGDRGEGSGAAAG